MGMFDYLRCDYGGVPDAQYQTKDTDAQYLENYKIDKDGYLWHEYREYKTVLNEDKEGIEKFLGCMKTTLCEWRKVENFRGEILFYTDIDKIWHEYSALFDKGQVISIERINTPPLNEEEMG